MTRNSRKCFALLLALAVVAGCNRGREFDSGRPLEPVFLSGEPGPTPTDERPGGVVMFLAFRGHDRGLVGCRSDGTIALTDLEGAVQKSALKTKEVCAYGTEVDGLLLRSPEDVIFLVDLESGERTKITEGPYVHGAVDAHGSYIVLSRGDKQIEVWKTKTMELLRTLDTADDVRNGLAISADGAIVAAAEGSYDESHLTRIEVWHTRSGKRLQVHQQTEPENNAGVWGLRLSDDGGALAAGTQAQAKSGLRVWDHSGAIRMERRGFHSYWVRGIALSVDGSLLVSGDERGNIVAWDVGREDLLADTHGSQVVQSVAVSADSRYVAAGLWDSRIGMWKIPAAQ